MLLSLEPISVLTRYAHIFDATKVIVDHKLTTLPIASASGKYLGLVKANRIFEQFATMLSTQEPGAIIALEVDQRDYSLAQLAYHIEQNDVRILSTATEHPAVSGSPIVNGKIKVTLKLNVSDTARVRHILEHYGYRVIACFSDDQDDDEFQRSYPGVSCVTWRSSTSRVFPLHASRCLVESCPYLRLGSAGIGKSGITRCSMPSMCTLYVGSNHSCLSVRPIVHHVVGTHCFTSSSSFLYV